MSFFIENEWLMFLAFSICVFVVCYAWSPKVLNFIYDKTLSSQKEVLKIIEMMRIQKDPKKTIISLWIFSLSMGLIPIFLTLPNILLGAGIGLFLFLMSWTGLKKVMQSLWRKYCDTAAVQMGEGMTLMANGMKVGLSVTQSMERVVKRMKGPLASEFNLVLNKIKLGMSLEEALEEMSVRVDRPDVIMMVTSINILKETGGNLAETFTVIAETIRSRQKVDSKIKALTAQSMMQAKIMSAIPFALMGILYFINKPYVVVLFTTVLGWVCLFIITILVVIGGKVMQNVAKIDV